MLFETCETKQVKCRLYHGFDEEKCTSEYQECISAEAARDEMCRNNPGHWGCVIAGEDRDNCQSRHQQWDSWLSQMNSCKTQYLNCPPGGFVPCELNYCTCLGGKLQPSLGCRLPSGETVFPPLRL